METINNILSAIWVRYLVFCLLLASASCFAGVRDNNLMTFQVIESEVVFNHASFEHAVVVEQDDHRYGVEIKLTPAAASELGRISRDAIGKKMNLVFDGKIISAAIIRSELGKSFLINCATKSEAEQIVWQINRSRM